MVRQFCILIFMGLLVLGLASCQERMICPAYQSTYILDDSVRSMFFSRFEDETMPKRYGKVRKTNSGLIKKKSKSTKLRNMRTVAMKDVLPPRQEPDSNLTRSRSLEELNRVKDEIRQD
jgi:hypothetical protein